MSMSASINITRFLDRLDLASETVIEEAVTFAEQAAQVGVEAARVRLDQAETPYGIYRMTRANNPHGRSTGRNDEGTMMDSLQILDRIVTDDSVEVSFGWEEDFPEYFDYQENGNGRIEDAHSLRDGAEAIEAELPRLARNMNQRIRRKIK